jgi:hypothetical protein
MSSQYKLDRDLNEAKHMAQGLEEYLRGNEVYGTPAGGMFGGDAPALTIGALVMRLRRLTVLHDQLSEPQQQALATAQETHRHMQREWAVHYEQKIIKEANSRLDAIRTFFEECSDHPRNCAAIYKPEVLRRTIVQELRRVMEECKIYSADLDKKQREMDIKLRGFVRPANFLWSALLQEVYPADEFWWLYHAPVTEE